jgi:cell division FtsZ-interacting protein ZapD
LHNDASKVEVLANLCKLVLANRHHVPHLFLFKNLSERLVNAFRAEVETQLPNYETSARIKQSSVSAEKVQQIDHKRLEITIV